MPIHDPGRRMTLRKRLILNAIQGDFAGRRVLWEELRWSVFVAEQRVRARRGKPPLLRMTRSYEESWRRTFTGMRPPLPVTDLGRPMSIAPQVLARAACFRLGTLRSIRGLLSDRSASCSISFYKTERGLVFRGEAAFKKGYRPVGFARCSLRWSAGGREWQKSIIFPQSRPLRYVGASGSHDDLALKIVVTEVPEF
jgi:hypothetical protein